MKNTFYFLIFLAFLANITALNALDAGVSYAVYSDGFAPYIEINIEIAAAAVTFKAVDSTRLQAGVETLILIKQGDKIINYEKYFLNSPITEYPQTLLDVKRLAVPNGEYEIEITFVDKYDEENKDAFKSKVSVNLQTTVHLTEVQLLRSFKAENSDNPFVKNGYFMEPLPFNFYDRSATLLAFYAEIYNTDKVTQQEYTVRSVIEQQLGNGASRLVSVGSQRKKPTTMDGVLIQMDISKIESGNYTLSVELRNKQGELLAQRVVEFQRSNPFLDIANIQLTDEVMERQFTQQLDKVMLRYSLRAIAMNVGNNQVEPLKMLLNGSDVKAMRFFLFNFFAGRNANSPEQAFLEYIEVAKAADKQFKSGFGYGFECDRGRTFMRFGRPDDLIRVEDDPAAPPYEIWIYNKFPATKQANVKFLFYNPSMAGEDFIVLHSTARGEINNPRWERELYKRNAGNEFAGDNYHDATNMRDNLNRRAKEYFDSF
jgi:GWxTD domain-containing protein